MTHKSEDYKISAVKYYLNNKDNIRKTCKIFDCKKSTLQRWIQRYKTSKNLTRRNRKSVSYKITKPQVKTALELLKQNEQLTMNELEIEMKKKYPTFDITPQHLGQVIRDNNKTRKRTRHEHFPKERYKKPIEKQTELNKFYNRVKQFPMNKIICLDETSVGSALKPTYSRCELGRRCVIKTSNQFVFRKFTYLVNEFRTSYMCSKCEVGICKKNMVRENPKPYRSGNVLIHGLICCKNGCGYWNRDVNGATNIYKIAYNAINNKVRPNYLSRNNKSSGSLDELPKPKFTRSAKGKPF
jgi:transposase